MLVIIAGAVASLALAAVAAAVILGAGEFQEPPAPEVTSAWPVAERERTIPRPPEPVRWPLTGIDAVDAEAPAATRIVSVKIENSPAARPQSNLDKADVVYETLTEGGITRFNALYHSEGPADVGPVRSARMSDTQVVPQYGALFANSGSSTGVNRALRAAGIENLNHGSTGVAYRRSQRRSAPHNLYLDVSRIREVAAERGLATTQRLEGFEFSPAVESTLATVRITVPFSRANTVAWTYDAEENVYLRVNNGSPHVDAVSGEQYSARNVVVMWARTSATGPSGIGGTTLEISLVGSNRATVFRDGVRIDCMWEASADKPPVFRDPAGRIVRLAPGNTWFQVIPANVDIVIE